MKWLCALTSSGILISLQNAFVDLVDNTFIGLDLVHRRFVYLDLEHKTFIDLVHNT
jgi:hypothetical protein